MQSNNEEEYLDFEEEGEDKKTGETNGKHENVKGYVSI